MEEFRIPKTPVATVCYTIDNESIAGDIFMDYVESGITVSQMLDFFNSSPPFFPLLKQDDDRLILLNKEKLVRVDVPGLFAEYETEVSSQVDLKVGTILYMAAASVPLEGLLIVDLPEGHNRVVDLLNGGKSFVPFLMEKTLTLIHTRHIHKVEEL